MRLAVYEPSVQCIKFVLRCFGYYTSLIFETRGDDHILGSMFWGILLV